MKFKNTREEAIVIDDDSDDTEIYEVQSRIPAPKALSRSLGPPRQSSSTAASIRAPDDDAESIATEAASPLPSEASFSDITGNESLQPARAESGTSTVRGPLQPVRAKSRTSSMSSGSDLRWTSGDEASEPSVLLSENSSNDKVNSIDEAELADFYNVQRSSSESTESGR